MIPIIEEYERNKIVVEYAPTPMVVEDFLKFIETIWIR